MALPGPAGNDQGPQVAGPFQCDVCLRTFTKLGGLKIHARIHTGLYVGRFAPACASPCADDAAQDAVVPGGGLWPVVHETKPSGRAHEEAYRGETIPVYDL